jgi:diamine N-acetyltransferase
MAGSSTAELRLRPTRPGDLGYVVAAESDAENAPYLDPSSCAEHQAFVDDRRQRHLIAEVEGRAVGFVLLRLHPEDRAVELRRLAVTEKGRGFGRQALRAVMRAAFEDHGAHRLWLDLKPHNERARALYRSEGFTEEGVLRDALLTGDRFESLVVMSLLRPEWTP